MHKWRVNEILLSLLKPCCFQFSLWTKVQLKGEFWMNVWKHCYKNRSIFVMILCFCSQNPTADEILSWAQNFDKMMKTPAGRNLFREFLRTEYSEENLLFWLACEDLKKEQNKKVIEEKARLIYEDYISILSPKEVKL